MLMGRRRGKRSKEEKGEGEQKAPLLSESFWQPHWSGGPLGSISIINIYGKKSPIMPAQRWPNHGLAALESGIPDIQSAAAGAWSNPRVVSKLQMKWNAPDRVPLWNLQESSR